MFFVIINKIAIDITRAITPPSLFGIDCRIAYANRKYRSGWMCTGVTRGFAGVKLSGSLKMYGSFKVNIVSIIIVIANPRLSFTVKYGWNVNTCQCNNREDSSHGFYCCENEMLHSGRSTPLTISNFRTHYYHLYFKTQI